MEKLPSWQICQSSRVSPGPPRVPTPFPSSQPAYHEDGECQFNLLSSVGCRRRGEGGPLRGEPSGVGGSQGGAGHTQGHLLGGV